ncbi:energy-coupling factor transport system ATP-binding protein [Lachnotalea glycerini]|uniref:Energy-coupling factor transport system ATP-binding protein n=1 Tax=Lachnotalea glycerini TaxID=1763509 RepID=A0A318ESI2_9FIRM|nr:energy-coupling factor ABC transporter ATP-binding protein [Lachnotalea glycerini]PXV95895.1 energy-coupling factor transport system ATP-binding protein [Lachnotalea glycerini]
MIEKIRLDNISFAYDGTGNGKIKNISFSVSPGGCVVLTGRSGCGKTTVTRMINGLIPEFFSGELTGSVFVDGENLADKQLYEIAKKIGSVFQNPKTQFFNTDTDGEIAFGMENNGVPRQELIKRVKKTADNLNITNLLNRSIFSLSGGEKQKIAFASVYAMNPEVYLLDEPSSNLDTDAICDLREYIQILKSQGKTIIIAEHRLYYLKDLADEIYYMDAGEIKHRWTQEAFLNLSVHERKQLGLRSLNQEEPKINDKSLRNDNADIEIKDFSIGYGKKDVLTDINFKANKGDIIAVTGHNGVGKSTLLRTLCGLQKALRGNIFWNGEVQNQKMLLKRTYMVMQDVNYQLFADSVEQETCFGIKNPDYKKVEQVLKELDLYELKEKHPNTLSAGQKQRLAVAVSMLCDKDILVFDEPTSGLDLESMRMVSELMYKLAKMGKIIFLVTHDFELVSLACTRIFPLG